MTEQLPGPDHPDHARQVAAASSLSLATNTGLAVLIGALAELLDKNPQARSFIAEQLATLIENGLITGLKTLAAQLKHNTTD